MFGDLTNVLPCALTFGLTFIKLPNIGSVLALIPAFLYTSEFFASLPFSPP